MPQSMQALTAKLHIEGHKDEKQGIIIRAYNFNFSQTVDELGRQASSVRMGLIKLTLSSNEDGEIIQWMLGRSTRKNFKITFSGFGDSGPVRKILFEDAFLISYSESYIDQGSIVVELIISASKIEIAGLAWEVNFDNDAPKS